jgi:hypothetical protein
MENIDCPLLVVTFEHNTIVPKETATVLLERATSKDNQGSTCRAGRSVPSSRVVLRRSCGRR